MSDSFKTKTQLKVGSSSYEIFSLGILAKAHAQVNRLPFSLKVLLENLLRNEDGRVVRKEHLEKMLAWDPKAAPETEISFHPARVLLQDFTGVPAVVDLAAMREALARDGRRPAEDQPAAIPADLVIDHSVQVDAYATRAARARERRSRSSSATSSATRSCAGARARSRTSASSRPTPASVHQVNLEFLAQAVVQATATGCTRTRWWARTATPR